MTGRIDLVQKTPEVGVRVVFYVEPADEVREFQLRGATGMFTIREPTVEDRGTVSAHYAARLLAQHKLDMHDFKQIIDWALTGMIEVDQNKNTSPEPAYEPRLYDALDKIYHELGGSE